MKKFVILIMMLNITGCAAKHSELKMHTGLANPASVYCEHIGGKSIMISTKEGVIGNCILPSGKQVEEWSLYRHAHSAK